MAPLPAYQQQIGLLPSGPWQTLTASQKTSDDQDTSSHSGTPTQDVICSVIEVLLQDTTIFLAAAVGPSVVVLAASHGTLLLACLAACLHVIVSLGGSCITLHKAVMASFSLLGWSMLSSLCLLGVGLPPADHSSSNLFPGIVLEVLSPVLATLRPQRTCHAQQAATQQACCVK